MNIIQIIFILLSFWGGMWIISLMFCGIICRLYKARTGKKKCSRDISSSTKCGNKLKRSVNVFLNNLLYGYVRYITYRIGKLPSFTLRNLLVRKVLCADISKKTILYENFELRSPWNLHVGASTIGPGCMLDSRYNLTIHDGVNLSSGVYIWTEQHDINDPNFYTLNAGGEVVIHNHAWICSRATILPKVTVGEGAVVASGCVVSRDCGSYFVYGGVPNKKIGERAQPMAYELKNHWHLW